ncbi:MAG: WD40 repeat domain-containing protein, partial [Candidatus Thorarchaeota archaeon]
MRKKVLYKPSNSSCSPITALAIDPKGKRIACGMLDASIVLLSQKTGKPIRTLTGHDSMISGLSFINEGKRLISSSWDCTARHWTSSNGIQGESTLSHKTEFKALSLDSTGSKGAVG